MYQEGTSTNNIGRLLGFHKSHAVKVLAAHHVPLRCRRLTPSEMVAMTEIYADGVSGTEIAKQFGTTPTTVYGALERQGIERRPSYNGFLGVCNHDFFNIIDTELKAYFLGAMSGDGCVSQDNEIIFSLKHSDRALVEAFRSALEIGNPVHDVTTDKVFQGYPFRYKAARVSVNSCMLAEALARFGIIPAKTGRTRPALIPGEVPSELEAPYWRGWVDTDGWVGAKVRPCTSSDAKRRQFKVGLTGDRPVVEAFRDYCMRHTPTEGTIRPNHNIWSYSVTDSYAMQVAAVLYDGATVSLDRKHDAYLQWRALRPDWIR